jgi:hypothetical protein
MPRPKSPAGSKTNLNPNPNLKEKDKDKEQPLQQQQHKDQAPVSVPDLKAVAAQAAPIGSKGGSTKPEAQRSAPKLEPKAEMHKPEPRPAEQRKNVVPINLEDEIRRRAYELYLRRGNASGSEAEDWIAAEQEIRQRYHQKSA